MTYLKKVIFFSLVSGIASYHRIISLLFSLFDNEQHDACVENNYKDFFTIFVV